MMPEDTQKRLEELERFNETLKSDDSVSYAVENAFAIRLGKNKQTFSSFIISGSVTMSSGTATVTDGRITVNSVAVITPTTTSAVPNVNLRATVSTQTVTIASTDNTDARKVNYIIII